MSSLRDALLKKGLVSKKEAQRVERELKEQRRVEQGHRRRLSEVEAEEQRRRAEEEAAALARKRAERAEREAARAAVELSLRIRNLINGNRLRPGRGQPFWHKAIDGKTVVRIEVSSGTAFELRAGGMAIAALDHGGFVEYVVIPRKAALQLEELAPERLVCWTPDPAGLTDRSLGFLQRDWEPSLAAHRARDEDVERFRGD